MSLLVNFNHQNSALLLIEFQQEWLNVQGKLHHLFLDKKQLQNSVANAKIVLTKTRQSKIPIVHSGLVYSKDYIELGEAKSGLRAAIKSHQTFQNTSYGSQFSELFIPHSNEFVVTGRVGASAFTGSNLDCYLRNTKVNALYLMGYALHVCVESTMRAAHDLGYEVILIEDACAAFTQQQKKYVLNEVVHHFGTSIKTKDYLNLL